MMTQKALANFNEHTKPYRDIRAWVWGALLKWRVIVCAAFSSWVITNGVESSMHSVPFLSEFGSGTGVSWKASFVMAFFHAIYSGARSIAEGSRPPFPQK